MNAKTLSAAMSLILSLAALSAKDAQELLALQAGLLQPVTELTPAKEGDVVEDVLVRFRTVGDITCNCPVESLASTPDEIVVETLLSDVSERGATRMDDKTSEASMEKRKKDGYF